MRFESKFNLGQAVWHVANIGMEHFVECPSCKGGNVPLPDGRSLKCPRCNGKGSICDRHVHRYRPSEKMIVGQVRVQAGGTNEDDTEQYMTYERGVGSGSIFYVRDLFASAELAEAECEKRNNEPGREWVCVDCKPEFDAVKYSGYNEWRYCSVHQSRTNHIDRVKGQALLDERAKRLENVEAS